MLEVKLHQSNAHPFLFYWVYKANPWRNSNIDLRLCSIQETTDQLDNQINESEAIIMYLKV